MGYSIPQVELDYIRKNITTNWDRIWADPLVFARYVDFAEQEALVDRNKFIQRLRVAFARNESPSTFMVLLMQRFYEEGADAGLRKAVVSGVTYYCPPAKLNELRTAAMKYPGYQYITKWELPSNRPLRLGVYCYFLDPKHADSKTGKGKIKPAIWEREEWPEQIQIGGESVSIFFRSADDDRGYEREPFSEEENRIEIYRYAHDLLSECFDLRSPAAYSHPIDKISLQCLAGSPDDVLGNLSTLFRLLRVARARFPKGLVDQIDRVKNEAATRYSHLRKRLVRDADYQYRETMPLMDQGLLRTYFLAPFEIERAMKPILDMHGSLIRQIIDNAISENFSCDDAREPEQSTYDEERPDLSSEALQQYLGCHEDHFYAKTAYDVIVTEIARHTKSLNDLTNGPRERLAPLIWRALKGAYRGDPASGFSLSWPLVFALAQKFSVVLDGDSGPHREGTYGAILVYSKLAPYRGLAFEVKMPGESHEFAKAFDAFARVFSEQKPNRKVRI